MKLIINYIKPIYSNNKIINFKKTKEYIIESKKLIKRGGDIFDNLTIDDIIVKENDDKKNKIEIMEDDNMKNEKIKNIKLNENMTLYNLKELLYYITNIKVENQHIELYDFKNKKYDLIDYSYENINLSLQIDTKFNNININNLEYIDDIFIDFNLVNNRNLYEIKSFDGIKRLIHAFDIYKENEIDIYDLNDFISNKEDLLKKDNKR